MGGIALQYFPEEGGNPLPGSAGPQTMMLKDVSNCARLCEKHDRPLVSAFYLNKAPVDLSERKVLALFRRSAA